MAFATDEDVPSHDEWLSHRERDVLGKLRVEKRRRDWRLGRWVARVAAARLVTLENVDVLAAQDGAPEIPNHPDIKLSLSHSHGLGMAAVTRAHSTIGCDVEFIEPRSRHFLESYFTPAEIAITRNAEIANALWSAKESVLKAARVGLRSDPRDVEVTLTFGDGWQPYEAAFDNRCWSGLWRLSEGRVHTLVAG